MLRQRFPRASMHAFTATATARVRDDIVAQLHLREPAVLVGRLRPAEPRLSRRAATTTASTQVLEVLRRHEGDAGDRLLPQPQGHRGHGRLSAGKAASRGALSRRHGGAQRRQTQERFRRERLRRRRGDGGLRHGHRPQQRALRAAFVPCPSRSSTTSRKRAARAATAWRPSACCSIGGRRDALGIAHAEERPRKRRSRRRSLPRKCSICGKCSATPAWPPAGTNSSRSISTRPTSRPIAGPAMYAWARSKASPTRPSSPRRSSPAWPESSSDSASGHVVDVLLGADTEMIRRCRHQQLSTYGLLKEHGKKEVQGWIYQLLDQGLVGRSEGDYPVLRLNEQSWAVMRGQTTVRLLRAKKGRRERTRHEEQSWENADRGLFDRLREWRRAAASTRGVPPFVILHDTALQQMSIVRPTSVETLRQVRGIGERRAADFGPELVAIIDAYCREHGLTCDVAAAATGPEPPRPPSRAAPIKEQAFALSRRGMASIKWRKPPAGRGARRAVTWPITLPSVGRNGSTPGSMTRPTSAWPWPPRRARTAG